jgi:hypothetical protein
MRQRCNTKHVVRDIFESKIFELILIGCACYGAFGLQIELCASDGSGTNVAANETHSHGRVLF